MVIDERRRRRIEALASGSGTSGELAAFLSEPVAPLPWGQEATPGQELVEVARPMPNSDRASLASRLLEVVANHAHDADPGHLRAAEEAAFAVGMLDVDVDTDVLRRVGTGLAGHRIGSHCLRSAYTIEGRRGALDAPDGFWLLVLRSPDRLSRACAAHAVLSRATPDGRDDALRRGLSADLDRTSLATLAHRWATTPQVRTPDLPDDLRALLAAGLSGSGHDPALAGEGARRAWP